ncbi:hypothetical protein [Butyrivibrio proteoclasticus]|uniref:hypothetical protein n=1 Tax=Butyrivibrio proteoclasticus TaxID=43305 RepID=UPI001A9A6D78|nr:hypothetical protein [Butyrivibrio proteoclasticus]
MYGVEEDLLDKAVPIVITPEHAMKYIRHLFRRLDIRNHIIPITHIVEESIEKHET